MILTGLSPDDIEKNESDADKLEAYRVVYTAFWNAKMDAMKVSERYYETHKNELLEREIKITQLRKILTGRSRQFRFFVFKNRKRR